MTLRLDSVMGCSVRTRGEGGPQIVVEMEYLPQLSSNRRLTRNRYSGDTVLRYDVEKWMEQLAWMIGVLRNGSNLEFKLPVKVVLAGEFPNRKVPDVHNFVKAVCDAIEDGLGINDKFYSVDCGAAKVVPGCEPKLIITIGEALSV